MRGHYEIAVCKVRGEQGVVRAGRLCGEDIKARAGEVAAAESLGKVGLIHQRAPTDVQKKGSRFHGRQGGPVDHVFILTGERAMKRNDIGSGKEFFRGNAWKVGTPGIGGSLTGENLSLIHI